MREAGGDLDVESVVLRQADSEAGARKQLHGHLRLEALERRTAPQYGLDALVLPDHTHAVLTDLVQLERSRPQLLQRWGFGDPTSGPEYGRGTVALFHGPLGTGKTAAGALAFELGRTLQTLTAAEVMDRTSERRLSTSEPPSTRRTHEAPCS